MNKFKLLLESKHKIKDVYSFFIGTWRYKIPWLMRLHIREQTVFRIQSMKEECIKNGACVECGCDTPQLAYANKPCDGGCYPELLNKKRWRWFKDTCVNNTIKGVYFEYSKDNYWTIENNKFKKLMWKSKIHDLGVIPQRGRYTIVFEYIGNNTEKPNIQTTCGCTGAKWNDKNKTVSVEFYTGKLPKNRDFKKGRTIVYVTFPHEQRETLSILYDIRRNIKK